ncbi:polyphosphate kinase [Idiomarina fontislapidosi]|uniref:Polyphosphate kinase n=1 Tax=Idiomarina fontislapidosi TaxID=263723 RepID=A0A432XR89_9GAMM|nr:polyphosphate kinase 1 [Idiomarina fontislapidosi]PYE30842.1 polyphosphate kinase [Idiomarina fontislapidosi]RUO51204.1 polyphosphate kinase 1 [Idiomarina fontislapidosi]
MKFYFKELSWLSFNERVLQEANDEEVPVIERVRFLGIFSSNMDEFFQVRVADVRRRIFFAQNDAQRKESERLLNLIQQKVVQLQEQFEMIHRKVIKALRAENIIWASGEQVTEDEKIGLREYFDSKIKPQIVPILINDSTDLVKVINEDKTYLLAQLQQAGQRKYAAVQIPSHELSRFVILPKKRDSKLRKVLFLDDVVLLNLASLFKGIVPFQSIIAFSFKMTRDAEYRPSDDIEQSLLERMEEGLKQREKADPVRLVYDRAMPIHMLNLLSKKLHLNQYDAMVAGGRYRNTKDFLTFSNLGGKKLEHPSVPTLKHPRFEQADNVFDAIKRNDILLYYPYHRFAHFTEVIRQSCYDPHVIKIHMCIYRVAPNSRIIHSLMDAVQNGKKVTVMVELQARFDEEANIEWAKELTESGVKVIFGLQGLKVHSKLLLIHRQEEQAIRRYGVIGTGNFHEKTAKLYTDFSLFTCHPEICSDIENVFNYLEQPYRFYPWHQLLVAPNNLRTRINELIEREINHAKNGKPAEIFLKVNNLVDNALIVQLYRASRAGVRIRCIVRGMCTLRPNIPKLSENIEIISIVDRFLEHARVYIFGNDGDTKVFISSADLMTRNVDHRVEVACPIYDHAAQQDILAVMDMQWNDNIKARRIDAEQVNEYVTPVSERSQLTRRKRLRSQLKIHEYFKRRVYDSNK